MNYNYVGLFLIFTTFFHNIIIKPQECYITHVSKLKCILGQLGEFCQIHICMCSLGREQSSKFAQMSCGLGPIYGYH